MASLPTTPLSPSPRSPNLRSQTHARRGAPQAPCASGVLALLLATGLLCSSPAWAQSADMQGFSIAVNLNASGNSIDSTATIGAASGSSGITAHSNTLGIQLQYAQALSAKTALTVGLSTLGQGLLIGTFIPTGELVTIQDMNTLYLAPGIFASDKLFIYGKLAGVFARTTFGGGNPIQGSAYGLGAQYFTSKHMFVQTELVQNTFDNSNHDYLGAHFSDKYVVNMLSLGVGYKF